MNCNLLRKLRLKTKSQNLTNKLFHMKYSNLVICVISFLLVHKLWCRFLRLIEKSLRNNRQKWIKLLGREKVLHSRLKTTMQFYLTKIWCHIKFSEKLAMGPKINQNLVLTPFIKIKPWAPEISSWTRSLRFLFIIQGMLASRLLGLLKTQITKNT